MKTMLNAAILAVICAGVVSAAELKDIRSGDVARASREAGITVAPAAMAAAAGARDYSQDVSFPSGRTVGDLNDCAEDYGNEKYMGCYSSPEMVITIHEKNKPDQQATGVILSKIRRNDEDYDASGYGYCLKFGHPFEVMHEVRILEKGKVVAHPYPGFYASAFTRNEPQNFYAWGGAIWGSASCDKTNKTLSFVSDDTYTVTSPEAVMDFGNVRYTLNVSQLQFTRVRP